MIKNIYNISIEREALRCDEEGKISKLNHPLELGKNNRFITKGKEKAQIKICTPICEDYKECYIKLEELTDVILNELHKRNELLWYSSKPCLETNLNSKIKVCIEINKDNYKEIAKQKAEMPKTISKAYENIRKEIQKKECILQSIFGEIKTTVLNDKIEICNIEINPFNRSGISEDDMEYLIAQIFSCLYRNEKIEEVNNELVLKCKNGINNEEKERIAEKINELSFEEILEISKNHMKVGYDERYRLRHYPKLLAEAAILIKDALSQGIDYKILNETTSFAELNDNGHKEFIIEGNRTDRDSYIFPIITDDKLASKEIMSKYGLNVPEAVLLNIDMEKDEIKEIAKIFYNKCVVVKPRNTNKGTGITVFNKLATEEQIDKAIKYAFEFDEDVLLEEYIKGMEYRFLVVDGKCVSVCHRRAASVVGDGKMTIRELIEKKNKEPWHALTYAPVKVDQVVEEYLKLQGCTYDSIPKNEQRVFLRTNSNCSTGGESIDMTYVMPEYFKKMSEKAAKAFNAKVAGVDLIIDDIKSKDYSVIEINDDPGYSINEWPYEGPGEKVGIAIMKLVGYLK